MDRLHIFLLIALISSFASISSVEGTLGMLLRGHGINNQYYTGSGVGPLWMFRSSAQNAAIAKAGFAGHPIQQSLAMAFGDEFPKPRDDFIQWNQRHKNKEQGKQEVAGTGEANKDQKSSDQSKVNTNTRTASASAPGPLTPFANSAQWSFDKENAKNEFETPYRRSNPLSAIATFGARLRDGFSSSFATARESLLGASASKPSSGPRITIDTPTRSPYTNK